MKPLIVYIHNYMLLPNTVRASTYILATISDPIENGAACKDEDTIGLYKVHYSTV